MTLSCAASCVRPEAVFDTGLGDLFVVRVAGNVADDASLASIDYAVEHLSPTLVVVLGHQQCGAVKAALTPADPAHPIAGHIPELLHFIEPAVKSESPNPADTRLARVTDANVRNSVKLIEADDVIGALAKQDQIAIIGGRYDLDTGEFHILTA